MRAAPAPTHTHTLNTAAPPLQLNTITYRDSKTSLNLILSTALLVLPQECQYSISIGRSLPERQAHRVVEPVVDGLLDRPRLPPRQRGAQLVELQPRVKRPERGLAGVGRGDGLDERLVERLGGGAGAGVERVDDCVAEVGAPEHLVGVEVGVGAKVGAEAGVEAGARARVGVRAGSFWVGDGPVAGFGVGGLGLGVGVWVGGGGLGLGVWVGRVGIAPRSHRC